MVRNPVFNSTPAAFHWQFMLNSRSLYRKSLIDLSIFDIACSGQLCYIKDTSMMFAGSKLTMVLAIICMMEKGKIRFHSDLYIARCLLPSPMTIRLTQSSLLIFDS